MTRPKKPDGKLAKRPANERMNMDAKKTCRHKRAWPTIFNQSQGYLWCSDCGAIRRLRSVRESGPITGTTADTGGFVYAEDRWIYPRGHEDVLKQMERVKSV